MTVPVSQRLTLTILRMAPVRWLVAELIPFVGLTLGLMTAREWHPIMAVGYFIALFGTYTLSILYLYKVIGTAVGWCLSLFPLIVANIWVGGVTIVGSATAQGSPHSAGTKIVATTSWWIAGTCLGAALAVTVAAAIINGERWMRRNLPRNKFAAYAQSRGALTRLWLT